MQEDVNGDPMNAEQMAEFIVKRMVKMVDKGIP
jgi:hypothetical protein